MAGIRGQKEYRMFLEGKTLSYKQCIMAQHYVCNGFEEGGEDCGGTDCPLYSTMPYNPNCKKRGGRKLTQEQKDKLTENLKRARKARRVSIKN